MNKIIELLYYIFALVYTFKLWGFWWGLLSIVLPIFPLIDLASYLTDLLVK